MHTRIEIQIHNFPLTFVNSSATIMPPYYTMYILFCSYLPHKKMSEPDNMVIIIEGQLVNVHNSLAALYLSSYLYFLYIAFLIWRMLVIHCHVELCFYSSRWPKVSTCGPRLWPLLPRMPLGSSSRIHPAGPAAARIPPPATQTTL